MTEVDGQSARRMHLSEYPDDAWASPVLVKFMVEWLVEDELIKMDSLLVKSTKYQVGMSGIPTTTTSNNPLAQRLLDLRLTSHFERERERERGEKESWCFTALQQIRSLAPGCGR